MLYSTPSLTTTPFQYLAPSQTLPDHLQEPLNSPDQSGSNPNNNTNTSANANANDSNSNINRSNSNSNTNSNRTSFDENDGWEEDTIRALNLDHAALRAVAHSRQSSFEKVQSGSLAGIPESPKSTPSSSSTGPRSAASRPGIGGIFERVVDPKASATYGHHRQTSIVHGIQHSRNGSSSSSPLSPQIIAAAGASLTQDRPDMYAMGRVDSEASLASRPPTALSGTTVTTTSPNGPENVSSASVGSVDSATTRRDHAHHHSHSHSSRHRNDELKTVGEYALHVLLSSVSLHLPYAV